MLSDMRSRAELGAMLELCQQMMAFVRGRRYHVDAIVVRTVPKTSAGRPPRVCQVLRRPPTAAGVKLYELVLLLAADEGSSDACTKRRTMPVTEAETAARQAAESEHEIAEASDELRQSISYTDIEGVPVLASPKTTLVLTEYWAVAMYAYWFAYSFPDVVFAVLSHKLVSRLKKGTEGAGDVAGVADLCAHETAAELAPQLRGAIVRLLEMAGGYDPERGRHIRNALDYDLSANSSLPPSA